MDLISIALAVKKALKTLFDSGQVGRVEGNKKTITFDGNTTGKETIPGEAIGLSGVYVKVSNTAFAVDELQSVSGTMVVDGTEERNEIPLSAITVQEDGSTTFLVQNNAPIAIVVAESMTDGEFPITAGTYFLYDENYLTLGTFYVSAITYGKETIHPIDPKYLPGVCLPVVEIADITAITVEECANLAACMGMPCIISYMGGMVVEIFNFTLDGPAFVGSMTDKEIVSDNDGVTWSLVI